MVNSMDLYVDKKDYEKVCNNSLEYLTFFINRKLHSLYKVNNEPNLSSYK